MKKKEGFAMYTTEKITADTFEPARFEADGELELNGKVIPYHTVSEDNVFYGKDGKPIASIFSYSYFRSDVEDRSSRPVIFGFNGGPGSSSMFVHAGFLGAKRVVYEETDRPTALPPYEAKDNPDCLLDIADIVLVDPVGTGYGLLIDDKEASTFFGIEEDAEAFLVFVEKWLHRYNRWLSPKYIIGESYGCTRASVAAGIADKTGVATALITAAVVGGAMFGDNLSFISDTTIVATRTQGCRMKDKFRTNFRIVMPFAVLTVLLYFFIGKNAAGTYEPGPVNWLLVLPYIAVLAAAVTGMHVMAVLLGGTVLAGLIGLLTGSFDAWGWTGAMGAGINGMGELIVVTILAGGMLEMIRLNGGFAWIIQKMTARTKSVRGAELSIAGLVGFANLCTANNTIALIMAGPIAKEIATRFKIPANRSASLLDITSCFVQGIIPYGAQLLMAAGLANISPIAIMQYLYYPYLLGIGVLTAACFGWPHKGPRAREKKKPA